MRVAFCLSLLCISGAFAQPKTTGWRTDYEAAKAEAKRSGKPMFVVIRCEPCVDFAKLDRQVDRLAAPLSSLAEDFIRVRLTRITGLDLALFEFDFDLSWAGFFLSADEVMYGRYGGRDATSDKSRISLAGLKYAADKALAQHKQGASGPEPKREKPILAEDFRGARARKRNECIHCHQINTFRWADATAAGTWSRDDLRGYPLPENVGMTLEVDRGDVLKAVAKGSAAAKAGLKVGDVISRLNSHRVASFADAQFALHKAPKNGAIPVEWLREGKPMSGKIEVAGDWRNTDPVWRTSMFDMTPTLPIGGKELSASEKKAIGLSETRATLRQDKFVHSTLRAVGLKLGDVIVGINGEGVDGTMADFHAQLRREYLVGDKVKLNFLRDGKAMEVEVTLK